MIESLVDLTYRGLSLGRRIKLTQVRPNSGTLELAIPMPVGTHIAITTEEGVTFDATVSWVYEQVAGIERAPGMVVVPAIALDPAASWWNTRVTLPDEDKAKPRPQRGRPMTVRPRSHTEPAPPPAGVIIEEEPTLVTDLDAHVAAAAGGEGPKPAGGWPTVVPTVVMNTLDQQVLKQLTRSPDGESVVRSGEHAVIDDGKKTVLMAALDPSALGLEPGASGDSGAQDDPDGSEAGEAGEAGEASETDEISEAGEAGGGDKPPATRGFFKKRRKRR